MRALLIALFTGIVSGLVALAAGLWVIDGNLHRFMRLFDPLVRLRASLERKLQGALSHERSVHADS